MDSRVYWIWLAQALGPGSRAMEPLLGTFGVATAVYKADATALQKAGVPQTAIRRMKDKSLDAAHRILDRTLEAGDWVLTPEDALYPTCLRRLEDMPAVLYCRGVMPPLDTTPAVAVVGTRRASPAGEKDAYDLAAGLAAAGMVVVSGGATGIDAAVHSGALAANGVTILVMACPLDVEYPAENRELRHRIVHEGGLLVSEYPMGEPYKCVFPVRNRIIMGLSQGICLAETPARSGARITARLARENGRDVFALPGALAGHHNDGAHREIRSGATLVTRAADIVEEYATLFPGTLDVEAATAMQKQSEKRSLPKPEPRSSSNTTPTTPSVSDKEKQVADLPDTVSDNAKAVYAALTDTPQPVDVLAEKTGLSVPLLLVALTELELVGCARNCAGQQYCK